MIALLALMASSATPPVPPPHAAVKDSMWFRAVDHRDFTEDGVPDTLILQATGKRVDSLQITFEIRSQGRRLYHEHWLSTWYFQNDGPVDNIGESVKRERVFRHLREFFQPRRYGALDTAGAGKQWSPEDGDDPRSTVAFYLSYDEAFDSLTRAQVDSEAAASRARKYAWTARVDTQKISRAWQAMVRRRPVTFTFFSGGEYTRTIAWSQILGRFVVVFSCC